jgi:anti-anti-sigma factor
MEIMRDNQGVLLFRGNMVVPTIEAAHSSLESFIEDTSQIITVDLSNVEDIDIAGLQLLYSLKKTFDSEGALRIRAISKSVQEIMEISGFSLAMQETLP